MLAVEELIALLVVKMRANRMFLYVNQVSILSDSYAAMAIVIEWLIIKREKIKIVSSLNWSSAYNEHTMKGTTKAFEKSYDSIWCVWLILCLTILSFVCCCLFLFWFCFSRLWPLFFFFCFLSLSCHYYLLYFNVDDEKFFRCPNGIHTSFVRCT